MEKIRHFLFLTLICALFFGCGLNQQISDTANYQVMAYASGKGMGVAINEIIPGVDADLGDAWKDLIKNNEGNEIIPADQMVIFYNDCIGIISAKIDDPYGLIQDLSVMLTIYGAQFDESGKMTFIQPVPMNIMRYFEMGYRNGRRVALKT